jgi:hypothetical protein
MKEAIQTELMPVVREPAAVQTAQQNDPGTLLRLAVESGAEVDKLEKLMDLQERWQKEQARRAYFSAMNCVQAKVQPIVRDSFNSQTNSKYAKLEKVHKILHPITTEEGFSLSFGEGDSTQPNKIRIECDCMHRDGHMQHYHVDLDMDDKGMAGKTNKTLVHGKGSTITYARRYLEAMIFDLSFLNEDDDGNGGESCVTPEQAEELDRLIIETDTNRAAFMKWAGVAMLAHFPARMLNEAKRMLAKKAGAR